jgi:hypothetical protein
MKDSVLQYNLFAYCLNNPVNLNDPSGHDALALFQLFLVAMALIALAAFAPAVVGLAVCAAAMGAGVGGIIGANSGGGSEAVLSGVANGMMIATGAAAIAGIGAYALTGAGAAATGSIASGASSGGSAGFNTFNEAKKYLGSAGEGNQWHHIVEQSQIQKSGFSSQVIHNTDNLIAVNKTIHGQISGYYNTKNFDFTGGVSVRNWLAGQSFEKQYEFGTNVLKQFGVKSDETKKQR